MAAHTEWTPEMDAILRKYQQQSNYLLARMLGVDHKTVARRRTKLKLKFAGQLYTGPKQPGASVAHAEPYRPPGWRLEDGPPCRGCENYPPIEDYRMERDRWGGLHSWTKPVCTRCAARVEWCRHN